MNKSLVGAAAIALLEHYAIGRYLNKCIDAGAVFRPAERPEKLAGFTGRTDIHTLEVEIAPLDSLGATMLALTKEVRHAMHVMHGLWRLINTLNPMDYLACRYLMEADALAFQAQAAANLDDVRDRTLIEAMSEAEDTKNAITAYLARRQSGDPRPGYLAAMATFSNSRQLDHIARETANAWRDGIFGKGDLAWAARTGHNHAPGHAKTFNRALANIQRTPDRLSPVELEVVLASMQKFAAKRAPVINDAITMAYATRK